MERIIIQPDHRLRMKMYIQWFIVLVLIGVPTILIGYFVGLDEGETSGAMTGLWITLAITALWAVPWLLIIHPYYKSLQYEILDDEVVVRAGVITRSVKHVPYRTVTNIETTCDPFDRWFNIGTLKIQTAGAGGQSTPEEKMAGLVDYNGIYQQVAAVLRQFRGGMAPTQTGEEIGEPSGALADQDTMRAILAEVRAIREAMDNQM